MLSLLGEQHKPRYQNPIALDSSGFVWSSLSAAGFTPSHKQDILPELQEGEGQVGQVKIQADIVELPLRFIANTGQADASMRFIVKAGTQTIFFTPQEIVFAASGETEDEVPRNSVARLRFSE